MVETIVELPRGEEVTAGLVGAACGLVIGSLGFPGGLFAAPMVLLWAGVATAEVIERKLPTAVVTFFAAGAAVAWRLW